MSSEHNMLKKFSQRNVSYDISRMREMLKLVEELRNSCNGWQKCIVSLVNGDIKDDKMRFLCLQTVEQYMKHSYAKATTSEQTALRRFLLRWIQIFYAKRNIPLDNFVKNKVAQLFCLAFIHDYPERWRAYFDDLINTLSLGPKAVEHYLRVMKAINSEIADRCLSYSILENQINKGIRQEMREKNIQQIVLSLYEILKTYETSYSELTSACLETIAMYAQWIDVGPILENEFMNILARLITVPRLRESVIVCVEGIVRKKMEPIEKCKLVEFLISTLQEKLVLNQLSTSDSKFATKLAKLINRMGITLLDSYEKLKRSGTNGKEVHLFEVVIEDKIPILLRMLANDEDPISQEVVEFAKSYINFLKNRKAISESETENLRILMFTTVHKMKYKKMYDYDSTCKDYLNFQEFRKGLKIILHGIIYLNEDLVFSYILELTNQKIKECYKSLFADVEVTMTTLLYFGELSSIHPGKRTGKRVNLELLINIVLDSQIVAYPHPIVQVLFFEVMVRFVNTLLSNPDKVLTVIKIFLDIFGLRHPNSKVRSRISYLFCKFIKASRSVLRNSSEEVLDLLREILSASQFPCYDRSSEWLSTEDQLYIFEVLGMIILSSSLTDSEKNASLNDLMMSNINAFKGFYQQLLMSSNYIDRESLSDRLGYCVSVATRLSKGFTEKIPMESIGCNKVFTECLNNFLDIFNITYQSIFLRNSFHQFFKRMIASLNSDIIPFIMKHIMHLIQSNDLQNIEYCLQYLVQITYKFRNESLPIFRNCLPLISKTVSKCLALPTDENVKDEEKRKEYLKKIYFQFISALIISVPDAFYIQNYSTKNDILSIVAQTAFKSHNLVTQKECFLIFKNLISSLWERDSHDLTTHFLSQTIIDVCFKVLHKKKDPEFLQATLIVSQDCAICLKGIHNKLGDEMVKYILDTHLSSVPSQSKEQFTRAINSDIKTLLTFLRVFYGISDNGIQIRFNCLSDLLF